MKHFIFDLDGTLIDTESAVLKTWQMTLGEYGHDFPLDRLRCVLGVTTEAGLGCLHAEADEHYAARWRRNYAVFAPETRYFPGARETLLALLGKGCRAGAVSSRTRREYADFFSRFGFDAIFDAVILAEDTLGHKPDPEPLLKYLETTGADPADCVYIGDMPGDIACANRAGVLSGLAAWNGSGIACPDAGKVFHRVEDVLSLAK